MSDATRDMCDHTLDAAVAIDIAPEDMKARVAVEHCASMLLAYVDAHMGGFVFKEHAACLRLIADSMVRMSRGV